MREDNMHQLPFREAPEDASGRSIAQRWLSVNDTQAYTGLSRSSVMKLGEAAGCIRHFGRRVMFDRLMLDQYLEKQK